MQINEKSIKLFLASLVIFALALEAGLFSFSAGATRPLPEIRFVDSWFNGALIKLSSHDVLAQSFYLRESSEILDEVSDFAENNAEASAIFVGDIMLSRTVNDKMKAYDNYFYPFEKLSGFLNEADITFGNLESPIYSGKYVPQGSFSFDADPKVAESLENAGFDVLSLANNHAANAGDAGFKKTFEVLNQNNIKYVGAGENLEAVDNQGAVFEVNGIRIVFLAYAYGSSTASSTRPGAAPMNIEQMKKDVVRLKKDVDQVFVSMHAGVEYTEKISNEQRSFAQAAIDAGATLVVGHHPHVVQKIEKYKDGYIMFSLGNFIFDQMWSADTTRGLAVKAYFNKNKISRLEYYPLKIYDFAQPQAAPDIDRDNVLARMAFDFDESVWLSVEGDEIKIKPTALSVFEEKNENLLSADINQNGATEYFYLKNNKAYIVEDNALSWQSFADWRVNKIFLADSNNDGQTDFNLLIDDESGSRWLIYGWREGSWQPYWNSGPLEKGLSDLLARSA
ncbi:MAG TPA: CapA family protein [Candidatus Bipolaricaulota bacterium]|nr:CapA family protein [Candidatus Bipolaricaulota bacterium]